MVETKANKITIITNFRGLKFVNTDNSNISFIEMPRIRGWRDIVQLYFFSRSYDYMIINGNVNIILVLCCLKTIIGFNKCSLICLDIFLPYPRTFKEKMRAFIKAFLLKKIDLFLVYFKVFIEYEKFYNISPKKMIYVPFKINSFDLVKSIEPFDHNYIFSGGRSRRDYVTLIKAIEGLDIQCNIVAPDEQELNEHGTSFQGRLLPKNVQIVHDDGTSESFIDHIARSSLVVIPLFNHDLAPSGISVYLVAMALKKCVIISRGYGVDQIIPTGSACVVEPEDPNALRAAIDTLWHNEKKRKSIAENGYLYAMSLGGEKELCKRIIDVILLYHKSK